MNIAAQVRRWWLGNRTVVLRLAITIMAVASVLKLGDEFRRLLLDQSRIGAIDLMMFHTLVQRWFAGLPVYEELRIANLPPASYVMLWPLVGWLGPTAARWLWAITSLIAP